MEHSLFSSTPKVSSTQPRAPLHSRETPLGAKIPLLAMLRSYTTPKATSTQPSVMKPFLTILTEVETRPMV